MEGKVAVHWVLGLAAALVDPSSARADAEEGACIENFALANFQPKSPTFGRVTASSSHRPRATLIALLASY